MEESARITPQFSLSYQVRDQTLVVEHDPVNGAVVINIPLADILAGVGDDEIEATGRPSPPAYVAPGSGESPEILAFRREAIDRINWTGKTVLDVGGYDGWASQEVLARGARAVTIIDNGQFVNYHWRIPRSQSNVRYVGSDILAWQDRADVLIAGGLIYHVHDPWRTLWHFRCLAREMVLWSSYYDSDEPVWKVMDVTDPGELMYEGVYTVMWMPSSSGLVRLCRRTGWQNVELLGPTAERIAVVAR